MKRGRIGLSWVVCAGLGFACGGEDSASTTDALPGGADAWFFPDLVPLDALPVIDSGGGPVPVDASPPDAAVEPPQFEARTLSYDDGRGRFMTPAELPGDSAAVRFTAPAGTVVDQVDFEVSAEVWRTLNGGTIRLNDVPFRLRIAAVGEGGAPGHQLFPREAAWYDVAPKQPEGNGHLHIDLRDQAVVVPGEFFVVMEWPMILARGSQALGFDASRPDGRTWLRLDGHWRRVEKTPGYGPMDAMIRARVRAPAGILPPPRTTLGNLDPECTRYGAAGPWDGEGGLLAAARIESPADGFAVGEIRLQLTHDKTFGSPFSGTCDATTPFSVELSRGKGGPPAKAPEVIERFDVALRSTDGDPAQQVRLVPLTPIVLDKAEGLFVAVRMERPDDEHVVCLQTCRQPATTGTDYWSTHKSPPYGWVPFAALDDGGASNLDIEVEGEFTKP